jgi:branched-chain amino acid transport system substrate-binding protein
MAFQFWIMFHFCDARQDSVVNRPGSATFRGGVTLGKSGKAALAVAVTVMVLAAGCSSSKSSNSSPTTGAGSSGSGGGKTFTVGVLTDLTGLGSANSASFPLGIQAGVGVAATEGYTIKYDVVDTATSPSQALSGAQKLVEQDHVFAILGSSSLLFAAAPYLKAHGIPVVGASLDAGEWITDPNMFSVIGTEDYTKVYSQFGVFLKLVGGTNLASLGYSISPSSSESAKGVALSAQAAGLKVGYLNTSFPFGGTNVGPAVLAMKAAAVNSFSASLETNTEFAMITGLRQQGVDLKAPLLATGYGGDLAAGGPGAQQAAQGVYFLSAYQPVEMNTAATQKLQAALSSYAGVKGDPTFAEYNGYASVDALIQGLKAAGSHPTQASFITAMQGITDYNAAGLFGSHSVSFALNQRGQASGPDNCYYVAQYSGSTFHPVAGAVPICGAVIPGKTVSP